VKRSHADVLRLMASGHSFVRLSKCKQASVVDNNGRVVRKVKSSTLDELMDDQLIECCFRDEQSDSEDVEFFRLPKGPVDSHLSDAIALCRFSYPKFAAELNLMLFRWEERANGLA
jgi:hypothetical protein